MIHISSMMSEDEYLEQSGVKGMKWGQVKERSTERTVLKKGTEIKNISGDTARSLDGHVYGAHLKQDVLTYKVDYSFMLKMQGAAKIFDNTFETKKDLHVASEKEAYDAFKKVYEKDPEKLLRSLAAAKKNMEYIAAIKANVLKMDSVKLDEKYYQALANRGSKNLEKKGYERFVSSLAISDSNRTDYFKQLGRMGVGAIVDRNDLKAMGTDQPLLIFKGTTSLKSKTPAVELSYADIELATALYHKTESETRRNKTR